MSPWNILLNIDNTHVTFCCFLVAYFVILFYGNIVQNITIFTEKTQLGRISVRKNFHALFVILMVARTLEVLYMGNLIVFETQVSP